MLESRGTLFLSVSPRWTFLLLGVVFMTFNGHDVALMDPVCWFTCGSASWLRLLVPQRRSRPLGNQFSMQSPLLVSSDGRCVQWTCRTRLRHLTQRHEVHSGVTTSTWPSVDPASILAASFLIFNESPNLPYLAALLPTRDFPLESCGTMCILKGFHGNRAICQMERCQSPKLLWFIFSGQEFLWPFWWLMEKMTDQKITITFWST